MFEMVVKEMDAPRRLQFCGFVAREAANQAGEAADITLRSARYASAEKLQSRLARGLDRANEGLTDEQSKTLESENGEALSLLSYVPSPQLAAQIERGGKNDVIGLLLSDAVAQCDTLLDSMGMPAALPAPSGSSPAERSFKWRGTTAQEAFDGTGLAPFASRMCIGADNKVADFVSANFAGRGKNGISLLDWAFECRDRSAFKALLDAGFDAAQPGQFDDPPLVNAAASDDTWYLSELLAHGVSPDSLGHRETALAAAYDPLEGGGGKSFQILRTAGASLNFPDPDNSMWNRWSVFADWEIILANWSEFKSDPVVLGRSIDWELDMPIVRGSKKALEALKARLISDYGVCFPVAPLKDLKRDQRGYYVQPLCTKRVR